MDIILEQLEHAKGIGLPSYATSESAGADLNAAINEDIIIPSGYRSLIPTGIKLELPQGFEAQIRPRSGLAYKHGVTVLNSPGTIDSDYRGEIKVLLINNGHKPFTISRGDRIAQMIIAPVIQASFKIDTVKSDTKRGEGGYGSTGVKKLQSA